MERKLNNKYYLMRHGQSTANKQGLIVSAPDNALNDYGLTLRGANQVLDAAINTRLNTNTIIVSSDYKRAIETANIMHSVLGIKTPVIKESLLRERFFGDWELSDHNNYNEVWKQDLINPASSSNKVESVDETLKRACKAIEKLETLYCDKTILLVGHGDVLQILGAYYQNISPRFHRSLNSIGNADIRSLQHNETKQKQSA